MKSNIHLRAVTSNKETGHFSPSCHGTEMYIFDSPESPSAPKTNPANRTERGRVSTHKWTVAGQECRECISAFVPKSFIAYRTILEKENFVMCGSCWARMQETRAQI